jgi:nitronate monooxygenase
VGTAESLADEGYRAALFSDAAHHTTMTAAISGRLARCLANRFTAISAHVAPSEIAAYPIAYDLGKALHAAAKAKGELGYGAQWAGQGAPLARAMPAADLVGTLAAELERA